jgi:hypothetical protein
MLAGARRIIIAALSVAILAGGAAPSPARAGSASPWAVTANTPLVAAAVSAGADPAFATLTLANKTSIASQLHLNAAVAFVLEALGLSGTYSQSATWSAGSGPALACMTWANLACALDASAGGRVILAGSIRSALQARAAAATSQTRLTVAADAGSAATDIALIAIGIVFSVFGIGEANAEAVVKFALELRTEALITLNALERNDMLAAQTSLLHLATRAFVAVAAGVVRLGIGTLPLLAPGLLEVKMAIAATKAAVALGSLIAGLVNHTTTRVFVDYTTPPPAPPAPTSSWTWRYAGSASVTPQAIPLPDGRVADLSTDNLMGGSYYGTMLCPDDFAIGWPEFGGTTAHIVDLISGAETTSAPSVVVNAASSAVALPDGRILLAGVGNRDVASGNGDVETRLATELLDPVANRWKQLSPPAVPGGGLVVVDADHVALVGGGYDAADPGDRIQLLTVSTGTWATVGRLPSPMSHPLLTLLPGGRLLAVEGDAAVIATADWTSQPIKAESAEILWEAARLLPDGTVALAGQTYGDIAIYSYVLTVVDVAAYRWGTLQRFSDDWGGSGMVLDGAGRLIVAGGWRNSDPERCSPVGTSRVVALSPADGSTTPLASLLVKGLGGFMASLPDGRIVASPVALTGNQPARAEVLGP